MMDTIIDYDLITDLSMTIYSDMPVWPGTEKPKCESLGRIEKDGYNLTRLCTNLHVGTHVDAPSHWIPDGDSIEKIPLERLAGSALLYRRQRPPEGPGEVISLEEVLAAGVDLNKEDILVVDCMLEELEKPVNVFDWFPIPSIELLEWLCDTGIKAYMTDAPAVDRVGDLKSPGHKCLLGNNIPIVENLRNLGEIGIESSFFIMAFPVKLKGTEGGLCRAAAFLKEL